MKYPNGKFHPKPCHTCAAEFQPEAPSNHYCSDSCKSEGYANKYYIRTYGLTKNQVQMLYDSADNKCQLCKSEGWIMGNNNHKMKLVVDHCHTTGKVRGVLCHNCNRALGLMKDTPELFIKAAEYLQVEGAETIM